MILNDWVELHGAIGEIKGMASAIDMTEEIDLKKLNQGLKDVAEKLRKIADAEKDKLEDVQKRDKKPDNKHDKKPSEKKPEVKP